LDLTPVIDFDNRDIQDLIELRGWRGHPDVEGAMAIYEFVRDEVCHSWDAQDDDVTCAASDVLQRRTGICYAKSHLLAALLRGVGIPAGFCYQRLVLFDDPADGYSIHGLNALYLASLNRWIRVDARGNNTTVSTRFDIEKESLAFTVRPELGEIDYPGAYAQPSRAVVDSLTKATSLQQLYRSGLPDSL
jgi:transglutaminase-like putative cysteine protease